MKDIHYKPILIIEFPLWNDLQNQHKNDKDMIYIYIILGVALAPI